MIPPEAKNLARAAFCVSLSRMKMNKKQRRLVRKMFFPVVALVMMTATMALAGADNRPTPSVSR